MIRSSHEAEAMTAKADTAHWNARIESAACVFGTAPAGHDSEPAEGAGHRGMPALIDLVAHRR